MSTRYRVRRSWLLVEVLLSYIAIALAGSMVARPNGYIATVFKETGEAWPIMLGFLVCGVTMMICVAIGGRLLSKYPEEDKPCFYKLAKWRRVLHTLLLVGWTWVFVVLAFYSEKTLTFFLLVSPAMIGFHLRGAWENVKAIRINRADASGRSVGDLLRHSIRG